MSSVHAPRFPDQIAVFTESGRDNAAAGVEIAPDPKNRLHVRAAADNGQSLTRIVLRWHALLPAEARILGDHWERGYGDLEWRGVVPERILPWYALIHDPNTGRTDGFGVQTQSSTIASWRIDSSGITLILDLRNGDRGVLLGDRVLDAATIVFRDGLPGESAFAAAVGLCEAMHPTPRRLPQAPVYGFNDWYWIYGQNSRESVLRDADLLASLTEGINNRPFQVIDAGWEPNGTCNGGPYTHGNDRFGDMASLAASLKDKNVRPGVWIRPLLSRESVPHHWRLPENHPAYTSGKGAAFLDPSVPDVLARVHEDVARCTGWGYELIKHDFTTFDITARWGFEMHSALSSGNWHFADRSRTTAEIVNALYGAIREGAGDALLIGCNTIGHLGAGIFELQRTGDDTSGRLWERTRKMGVNTLAFRLPQHNIFFAADADCVGITDAIPWEMNRQFLDTVARSGTPLFVSADPDAVGDEQRVALIDAFLKAATAQPPAEPLDWTQTTAPQRWRFGHETITYCWDDTLGAIDHP